MVLELVITCLSVITLSLRSSSLLLPLSSAKPKSVQFIGYLSQAHQFQFGSIPSKYYLVNINHLATHSV